MNEAGIKTRTPPTVQPSITNVKKNCALTTGWWIQQSIFRVWNGRDHLDFINFHGKKESSIIGIGKPSSFTLKNMAFI